MSVTYIAVRFCRAYYKMLLSFTVKVRNWVQCLKICFLVFAVGEWALMFQNKHVSQQGLLCFPWSQPRRLSSPQGQRVSAALKAPSPAFPPCTLPFCFRHSIRSILTWDWKISAGVLSVYWFPLLGKITGGDAASSTEQGCRPWWEMGRAGAAGAWSQKVKAGEFGVWGTEQKPRTLQDSR